MSTIVDVCIVGGGIGGLSAALALQLSQPHLNVKVFEKDCNMSDRKQGYGLTLTNNKMGPLAKLELLSDCIKFNSSCPSSSHYTFDHNGNILGYYGHAVKSHIKSYLPTKVSNCGGNEGNLRIPRQQLRKLLLEKLKPGTVIWGKRLINFIESKENVEVHFGNYGEKCDISDTEIVVTRVLVGADGIRSVVRSLIDQKSKSSSTLKYTGVSVIIGLSESKLNEANPLIRNRGFYVVDGVHRLFTMPFDRRPIGSSSKDLQNDKETNTINSMDKSGDSDTGEVQVTMWQLSFSGLSEEDATTLFKSSTSSLMEEAKRRTKGWFQAVQDLISQSIPGEVWGTALLDRDPMALKSKQEGSRVTCIGDACHPMSMFKGQGANQALEDGPLLAHWLAQTLPPHTNRKKDELKGDHVSKRKHCSEETAINREEKKREQLSEPHHESTIKDTRHFDSPGSTKLPGNRSVCLLKDTSALHTRLRCFEREAVNRSASKVLASRAAAVHLHSLEVLRDHWGVEGVTTVDPPFLVQLLREKGLNADMGEALDAALVEAVKPFLDL